MFQNIKRQKAATLLNINIGATDTEIKKAYRKASLRWHPDKNNNDEKATEMFKEITEAYNTLLDKTNIQDEVLDNVFNNFFNQNQYFTEEEQINIEAEDFFNFLHNIPLQQSMGIPQYNQPRKKKNLKFRVRIKVSDIWKNKDKKIKIEDKYLSLPLYYDNIIFKGDEKSNLSYIGVEIIDKVDNYKRKGLYDIEIIHEIKLYDLYRSHIIDIKLPDNSVAKIGWKKEYLDNIKDAKIKGFYLYNLGLPTPDEKRGKLWVIFSIILPKELTNLQKDDNIGENNFEMLIPEWFDFEEFHDEYNDRNITLKLKDFLY